MNISPYIYRIVNQVSGEYYFGSRWRNVPAKRLPEDDLWKHYQSSSKKLKRMIQMFGETVFFAEVLERFSSYDEAYWAEQRLIKQHINDPLCINAHYVDPDTKSKMFGTAGAPKTKEHKLKLSESIRKTKQKLWADSELRKVRSANIAAGQNNRSKEKKEQHAKAISEGWKKQTAEQKSAYSLKRSVITKQFYANLTEEEKAAISKRHSEMFERITCPHCSKIGIRPNMKRWHFDNCKTIRTQEHF